MELLGQDDVRDGVRSRAFEGFYRRHYRAVLAFAVRRLNDQETAREVALDVFGDVYRRQGRERRLLSALREEAGGSPAASPADVRVREVLDDLPAPAREVLVLKYWDGMAAAEIGALIGCSPGAVWVRLHRARQAFGAAWNRGAPMIDGHEESA